ncbi:MAG TPA: glycerol-3-phosphate acyltransferase, partial [Gammaproteobacteria bacterium]
ALAPVLACVVMTALLFWRHRGNIGRLRAGTEPRIGAKAADSGPAGSGS